MGECMPDRGQRSQSGWHVRHPWSAIILVVAAFTLATDLLAGLLLIQDYDRYRTAHPVFHHGLLPGRSEKGRWAAREYDVFTNSLGFRDAKVREIDPQSSGKRLLLIGDSFTEGIGVPWEESFAGILDSALSKEGIEVLNAAAVSYSPKFYYAKTKYLLEEEKLRFGQLFVFIDNSDPMNEITYEGFIPYRKISLRWLSLQAGNFFYHHSYLYYSIKTLLNTSRENPLSLSWNRKMGAAATDETSLESEEFIRATPLWSEDAELFEKWGKRGLRLAAENMEKLADLCTANHVKMTVVIYPWPHMIQNSELDNVQTFFWKDFCTKNNVGFVNLYPVFITGEDPAAILNRYFIPGDVHWNSLGHRLVADRLLESIDTMPGSPQAPEGSKPR